MREKRDPIVHSLVAVSFFIVVLVGGEYLEGGIDALVIAAAVMAAILSFLLITGHDIYRRSKAGEHVVSLVSSVVRGETVPPDIIDPALPTCWKERFCQSMDCPVYGHEHVRCWLVDGTRCRGEEDVSFPGKLDYCYGCEVFRKAVDDDPSRELEERFHDMLRVIGDRERKASDMYKRSELQRQMLEFLLNLSRKALSSLELDALLELVLRQIISQGTDFAAFFIRSKEGTLELSANEGFRPGAYPKILVDGGINFVEYVMEGDNIRLSRAVDSDPRVCGQFEAGRCPRSVIGVPLICRGKKLGVLVAGTYRDEPYTSDEVKVFQIAGDQIAMAVSNASMYESVSRMAATDGLTGLTNHRAFYEAMEKELGRARRYGRPLSLIMIDIDHFKHFNDAYGHPQGDKVLAEIAKIIKDSVRLVDTVARYGGEEFAVLLPETAQEPADGGEAGSAQRAAERIREAVSGHRFEGRPGKRDIMMTISLGVAEYPRHAEGLTEMVFAADVALYKAKKGGRNRVEMAIAPEQEEEEEAAEKS